MLKKGFFRHYKGKYYLVLFSVFHSETQEDMTLYLPLYRIKGAFHLVVRPTSMFFGRVGLDNTGDLRFEHVGLWKYLKHFFK